MDAIFTSLVNNLESVENKIIAHLQTKVNAFCDKHELEFSCSMGCFDWRFEDGTKAIVTDEYGTETIDARKEWYGGVYSDKIKNEDFKAIFSEWEAIRQEGYDVAIKTGKDYNEWYMTSLDNYNGTFVYKNGYPNPNPKILK